MRLTQRGSWWVVPLLALLATVNLGAADSSGLLIQAAKRGATTELRTLIKRNADVNAAEVDGTTALHWAVKRDDVEAVGLLLRAGANAKTANRYDVTPLSLACVNGNARVIELLLKAGADPNTTLPGGETALMTAARTGNVDAIKVLVARGARVDSADSVRGQNALMWAAAQGNTEAVRLLIETGADVNARSKDWTLGETAVDGNQADALGALPIEMTPLLFAVREDRIDTVRALLERGARVNDTLADGTSALVLAITNAHWEMAAVLLDRGADPNAADQGWSALHELARTRAPSIGQLPPPVQTGRISSLDLAKKLIERGADVNAQMWEEMIVGYRTPFKRQGATPFNLAAKGVDADLLRLLFAHGANPGIPNINGTTPLMAAAGIELGIAGEDSGTDGDALEAVKVILEVGGDVHATNKNGETALHGAARRGANAVVQLLVDHGARMDATERRGLTPYNYAEGKAVGGFRPQPQSVALLAKLMKERGLEVIVDNEYGATESKGSRRTPK